MSIITDAYNLEEEIFFLPYPDEKECRKVIESRLAAGKVAINAVSERDWKEKFARLVIDYQNTAQKEYYAKEREYKERLNAKYGGFDKRMENKHGIEHLPDSVKKEIHAALYELGSHDNEDEQDNKYAALAPLVLACEKVWKKV